MLSTLYWECFKGYILALRDKNVAFILSRKDVGGKVAKFVGNRIS